MCRNVLLLLLGLPAYSQFLSFGIKAGASLNDALAASESNSAPYDRHYIVGPTVEVRLPFHLSLEVDALYRRFGFDSYFQFIQSRSFFHTPVDDWQFPFLAKYEARSGLIRPFVDTGDVFRHASQLGSLGLLSNPNSGGFALGGGFAVKLLLFRVSPEIRYTHWFQPPYDSIHSGVQSIENQADFLLGLTFSSLFRISDKCFDDANAIPSGSVRGSSASRKQLQS